MSSSSTPADTPASTAPPSKQAGVAEFEMPPPATNSTPRSASISKISRTAPARLRPKIWTIVQKNCPTSLGAAWREFKLPLHRWTRRATRVGTGEKAPGKSQRSPHRSHAIKSTTSENLMCKETWRDDLCVVRTSRKPREHGRLGRAGTGVEKWWRVMRGEFSKNGTPPRRVPNFQPNSGVSSGLGVHWHLPSRVPDIRDSNIRSSLRNARFY